MYKNQYGLIFNIKWLLLIPYSRILFLKVLRFFFCLKLILLYKVLRSFCLKLNISINTKLIEFLFNGKLHIGPGMVLGYFNLDLIFGFDLGYFLPLSKQSPLDARGAATNIKKIKLNNEKKVNMGSKRDKTMADIFMYIPNVNIPLL